MFKPSYDPQSAGDKPHPDWYDRAVKKRQTRDSIVLEEAKRLGIDVHKLPGEEVKNVVVWVEQHVAELGFRNKEWDITRAPLQDLAKGLKEGKWTPCVVIEAFIRMAVIAQLLTNCLTEIWFDDARCRAQQLEKERQERERDGTWRPGDLWGVPISLKDQFDVAGKECVMGYASWVGRISATDSALVKILRSNDAILYCRTNLPQTLMWGETNNYVFGRTSNPHNRSLTCGGSSGGEGALLALGGSVGGFGTDIGGSIRIPTLFNGIYGLRPTTRILPYRDASNVFQGMDGIESTIGPLARSLEGLEYLFKTSFNGKVKPKDLDPKCVPISWTGDGGGLSNTKVLCVGVMWWDEFVMPHPPLRAALKKVVDALVKEGHKIVELKSLDHLSAIHLMYRYWLSDAGQGFRDELEKGGETIFPGIVGDIYIEPLGAHDYHQLNLQRDAYRNAYHDYWMSTMEITGTGRPVDALLFPGGAQLAPPHGRLRYVSYTSIWNILDYPVLTIPISILESNEVKDFENYNPISEDDKSNFEEYTQDPKKFENAPVGVQIVGRRWEEEKVFEVAKRIEVALKRD